MARLPIPQYCFDFETVVNTQKTRVWLWGSVNINTEEFIYGHDIDSFIDYYSRINCIGYFHNLKFDIQFIFYWLFHNGYKHVTSRQPGEGQFTTLISDMGVFYSAKIKFFNGGTMTLYDSLKLVPMAVREIPKAFGFDLEKLKIDYNSVDIYDLNHKATDDEVEYVKHDCLVVARAIKAMKERGMVKLTSASNALNQFKGMIDKELYKKLYPSMPLSMDKDIRRSYKGGWTYLNPIYKDKMLGVGRVYDVNSMYPWAMKYCELPWGLPVYYDGKYEMDEQFPLYVQCLSCKFKIRKWKYPSIQIKGSFRFVETEYLTESCNESVLLYLTNIDYKLLIDCYDIWDVNYICGYKFRSAKGIFGEYIDKWYAAKNENKKSGNLPMYVISKLMLNSLYGKFGSNPIRKQKYPYLDSSDDIVKYEISPPEEGKTSYVPVASFITSYCRDKIIRTAIMCGDRFVYADTDSIHIIGDEEPDIDIDEYRIGAFKHESTFGRAKFHRAKCYIEEIDGELSKKCAGLPSEARQLFNFDTMIPDIEFSGKLVPKNVQGGVVLIDRKFTIK